MGWDSLETASFRGITFDCAALRDQSGARVAVHNPLFSDLALLEDMGQAADQVELKAAFSGDDAEAQADTFLQALRVTGAGELVHPFLGPVQARATGWTVERDPSAWQHIEIPVTFVVERTESRATDQNPVALANAAQALEAEVVYGAAIALDGHMQALAAYDPDRWAAMVDRVRGFVQGIRRTIISTRNRVNEWLSVPDWLGGTIDDISDLANTRLGLSALADWQNLYARVRGLRNQFSPDDPDVLGLATHATVLGGTLALAGAIFADEADSPTMTPADIAAVRDQVRADCQTEIDWLRALQSALDAQPAVTDAPAINLARLTAAQVQAQIEAIKDAALQVQAVAEALITRRPPLVVRTVPVDCCPRLAAFLLSGRHELAGELLRLNPDLPDPAVIPAGAEVACYAE